MTTTVTVGINSNMKVVERMRNRMVCSAETVAELVQAACNDVLLGGPLVDVVFQCRRHQAGQSFASPKRLFGRIAQSGRDAQGRQAGRATVFTAVLRLHCSCSAVRLAGAAPATMAGFQD